MTTLAWLCIAAAAGAAGFVAGALFDHLRDGGSADLAEQLSDIRRERVRQDRARARGFIERGTE